MLLGLFPGDKGRISFREGVWTWSAGRTGEGGTRLSVNQGCESASRAVGRSFGFGSVSIKTQCIASREIFFQYFS